MEGVTNNYTNEMSNERQTPTLVSRIGDFPLSLMLRKRTHKLTSTGFFF